MWRTKMLDEDLSAAPEHKFCQKLMKVLQLTPTFVLKDAAG
jgi:hypothetical protein